MPGRGWSYSWNLKSKCILVFFYTNYTVYHLNSKSQGPGDIMHLNFILMVDFNKKVNKAVGRGWILPIFFFFNITKLLITNQQSSTTNQPKACSGSSWCDTKTKTNAKKTKKNTKMNDEDTKSIWMLELGHYRWDQRANRPKNWIQKSDYKVGPLSGINLSPESALELIIGEIWEQVLFCQGEGFRLNCNLGKYEFLEEKLRGLLLPLLAQVPQADVPLGNHLMGVCHKNLSLYHWDSRYNLSLICRIKCCISAFQWDTVTYKLELMLTCCTKWI